MYSLFKMNEDLSKELLGRYNNLEDVEADMVNNSLVYSIELVESPTITIIL